MRGVLGSDLSFSRHLESAMLLCRISSESAARSTCISARLIVTRIDAAQQMPGRC
ncbi:hypothetical protein NY08_2131 [Rhodococcus sp. B7740]|nr:hypothetical protein NY08_2131 [Rhodococcus sp. B7740]